jgi:hypothetical protein
VVDEVATSFSYILGLLLGIMFILLIKLQQLYGHGIVDQVVASLWMYGLGWWDACFAGCLCYNGQSSV